MKKVNQVLTVVVEITDTGFSAYAKELSGVYSAAETLSELKENIIEVLGYQVEYLNDKDNASVKAKDFEINYVVDLEQFFDYFSVINKTAFAEKYAKINPSLFRQYTKGLTPMSGDKLKQISTGLHKLADELNDLAFVQ
jgi:predicted RNase H-like HicB family nuclease